jgi:SAM-dependent methyltransferase
MDGQSARFYETIDEEKYVDYFEPMRKAQYARALSKLDTVPAGTLLDVGASYGWMVQVALQQGFDAYGIEPGDAVPGVDCASRIERVSLEDFAPNGRRFDVVTIWHALEHIRDPAAALHKIRALLNDDGILLVAVPNADGRLFRAAEWLRRRAGYAKLTSELFYFHNPNMHYHYFTPRSLTDLLEGCGFDRITTTVTEAIDWRRSYRRAGSALTATALRLLGPVVAASRFTAAENLIALARPATPS